MIGKLTSCVFNLNQFEVRNYVYDYELICLNNNL